VFRSQHDMRAALQIQALFDRSRQIAYFENKEADDDSDRQ
ncbi:MAG: hypothetical protein Q612_NSC00234G0005, partial [Negativicoccus succinicivorans DORA_17_25]